MKEIALYTMLLCCWVVADRPEGERVIMVAESYLGHQAPDNRSEHVDYWNTKRGVPLGSSYCATALSHWLDSAGVDFPVRSAVARDFITDNSIPAHRVTGELPEGTIVIWRRGESWQGHVGVITQWHGQSGETIEANTSPGFQGSQYDGSGVWRKKRKVVPTAFFRITHITKL